MAETGLTGVSRTNETSRGALFSRLPVVQVPGPSLPRSRSYEDPRKTVRDGKPDPRTKGAFLVSPGLKDLHGQRKGRSTTRNFTVERGKG